ncbi:MAG: outer membrane protein assembly factor BamD [Bdellovibrionia bacterium]
MLQFKNEPHTPRATSFDRYVTTFNRASRIIVFLLFACVSLGACSSIAVDENDPASVMADAENEIKSYHYLLAVDKLRMIKNKFPYSSIATDAQLRIADVYFLQESYIEAAASYEAFKDLHPKHPKAEYALFQMGRSYFKDIPSVTARDLASAHHALEGYLHYLSLYPHGEYTPQAQQDVAEIHQLLADKELLIGDFYFKRKLYEAARPRYEQVLKTYPGTQAAQRAQQKVDQIEKLSSQNPPKEPTRDDHSL